MPIPVIDLFAGPGGLGEGFSSVFDGNNERVFDIRLSIEKDANAHQTLELRSFVHQFPKDQLPEEYYVLLRESNLAERTRLREVLFEAYPEEAQKAKEIAWLAELGNPDFPSELIDERIAAQLNGERDWVLIGGPPCQAYSLVGRSRRQEREELNSEDHRVFLYKEYLRIIAVHQPAVFVMENVKGMLSAKLGKERMFPQILNDLKNPASVFPETESNNYKIYSLTTEAEIDENGQPKYKYDSDFLIKAEQYGVPQRRHRVILLGIRTDLDVVPGTLHRARGGEVKLKDVIGDLPKLRSSLGRNIVDTIIQEDGKKKRVYENVEDSMANWGNYIQEFREEIVSWNGFSKKYVETPVNQELTTGGEFIAFETPSRNNPLRDWYRDEHIHGVCNHESRTHLLNDLLRYQFSSIFTETNERSPKLYEYKEHSETLVPDHGNVDSGKFEDRFKTQFAEIPATTVTCHISKDGHYFIHYDPEQCRSWTVREAARVQTFPDNYLFCGSRTAQFHQVGNAVPPYLAKQIGEIVFTIFQEI